MRIPSLDDSGKLPEKFLHKLDSFPPSTGIVYDELGNVQSVTEDGITTSYTYDDQGNVATDSRVINGQTVTRTYVYDAEGNLTGILRTGPLFSDNFNRIDSASLGTASDGQAWDESTAFGIVGNAAKSSGSGTALRYLPGWADNVSATVTVVGLPTSSSPGVFFNYVDADNYYSTTGTVLVRRVGGVSTNLASFDGYTIKAGDRIKVTRNGTTILVHIDKGTGAFELVQTYTGQTQLANGTGFGLRSGGNAAIFDDFKVEVAH